jgi:type III secretion apparatus needle protein
MAIDNWSVKQGTGTGATSGFNAITGAFDGDSTKGITGAAKNLNDAMATADFSDPGTLIKMQVAMANYQVGLSTVSSMVKSFEDTLKGITQKM